MKALGLTGQAWGLRNQFQLSLLAYVSLSASVCFFGVRPAGADETVQQSPAPEAVTDHKVPAELAAKRTNFEMARIKALIPVLNNYLSDLDSLKKQYMRRGDLDSAVAVDSEIKSVNRSVQAASETVNDTSTAMDRMSRFLWGVSESGNIPAERVLVYYDVNLNLPIKIHFNKDGTYRRDFDGQKGTWSIENGDLVTVLPIRNESEKAIFPASELKGDSVKGMVTTGKFTGNQTGSDFERALVPKNLSA